MQPGQRVRPGRNEDAYFDLLMLLRRQSESPAETGTDERRLRDTLAGVAEKVRALREATDELEKQAEHEPKQLLKHGEHIAGVVRPAMDAVRRACDELENVVAEAHMAGRTVGICGQAPSDSPEFAEFLVEAFGPFGLAIGLNGVIILAYIVAIPANEIVIPTILMLTVRDGVSLIRVRG